MTEIRTTLERIERRVAMPEPAMDRLLRRRERKQRNERIAAAVVGLGVAAAGVVGAVVTLRVVEGRRPASGGGAGHAAADTGGFVLPTVAIWTAIVVLGLTVLAAVRLRARFVHESVERGGRGPGGAAASARRPAAVPGTAPRGGGNEMDSKPKVGAGIPQAQMPEIRFDEGQLRPPNRWLIGAVIALALAVVAMGAVLIVQAGSEEAEGLADPATVARVDDFIAAHNAMNQRNVASTVADWYTEDAILHEPWIAVDVPGYEVFAINEGRTMIKRFYEWLLDQTVGNIDVERVSSVLKDGDLVTFLVRDANGLDHAWSILFRDGKIAEEVGFLPDPESQSS